MVGRVTDLSTHLIHILKPVRLSVIYIRLQTTSLFFLQFSYITNHQRWQFGTSCLAMHISICGIRIPRPSPQWPQGHLMNAHVVLDLRSMIWALAKAVRLFMASLRTQSMCSKCVLLTFSPISNHLAAMWKGDFSATLFWRIRGTWGGNRLTR